jgi:capsular exopolysaccharide synthesis family protein
MDTIDRSDSNLPAQRPAVSLPARVPSPPAFHELAITSSPPINPQVIFRGLARHWWHILLLWLIVSAPVVYLIYAYVEPTFEAFSLLHFEPSRPVLWDPAREHYSDLKGMERYLQTQVSLIGSDRVLGEAVANPLVVNLPMIKQSKDSKADLRKEMVVEIVPDSDLIRVALASTDREEAAKIVTAVVEAYMAHNSLHTQSANKTLKIGAEKQLKVLAQEIETTRGKLQDLVKAGNVGLSAQSMLNLSNSKNADDPAQPTVNQLTEGQFARVVDEIVKTDFDLIALDSIIEARRAASKTAEEEQEQQAQATDKQIEARIREEFLKDPDVAELKRDIEEVDRQVEKAKGVARQRNEPARRAAEKRAKELREEYEQLWDQKYDEIKQRLQATVGGSGPYETLASLETRAKLLRIRKARQKELLEQMKVQKRTTNDDSFQFAYLNHELTSLVNRQEQVRKYLQQVEFETTREQYHVTMIDKAAAPRIPSNNKQIKYMAAAPIGLLFPILGLFLLLEVKAQRVADPDHLSTRIGSEVYALPPLPTARSLRKLSMPEADDHIEQFIQRLDHVRFAVCSNLAEAGKGRCVLITSAIGGEGKTTLAAQLAARCGNAGMSTLLIDADLRRAALCPLLDVPEGPGLSDVLKDEAAIDEVVVRVQGGTFNLLRAGTPVQDTSRVLHGPKFGLLIAQLRQLYDLVIIDSPPVLPVPDALVLGRWADGAVLAARYDISRFPQVERARRQLNSAGIAVLGTVINGMRHSHSYYGRYTYSRRQSPQPTSSHTI